MALVSLVDAARGRGMLATDGSPDGSTGASLVVTV
jgi:hypothetical protein